MDLTKLDFVYEKRNFRSESDDYNKFATFPRDVLIKLIKTKANKLEEQFAQNNMQLFSDKKYNDVVTKYIFRAYDLMTVCVKQTEENNVSLFGFVRCCLHVYFDITIVNRFISVNHEKMFKYSNAIRDITKNFNDAIKTIIDKHIYHWKEYVQYLKYAVDMYNLAINHVASIGRFYNDNIDNIVNNIHNIMTTNQEYTFHVCQEILIFHRIITEFTSNPEGITNDILSRTKNYLNGHCYDFMAELFGEIDLNPFGDIHVKEFAFTGVDNGNAYTWQAISYDVNQCMHIVFQNIKDSKSYLWTMYCDGIKQINLKDTAMYYLPPNIADNNVDMRIPVLGLIMMMKSDVYVEYRKLLLLSKNQNDVGCGIVSDTVYRFHHMDPKSMWKKLLLANLYSYISTLNVGDNTSDIDGMNEISNIWPFLRVPHTQEFDATKETNALYKRLQTRLKIVKYNEDTNATTVKYVEMSAICTLDSPNGHDILMFTNVSNKCVDVTDHNAEITREFFQTMIDLNVYPKMDAIDEDIYHVYMKYLSYTIPCENVKFTNTFAFDGQTYLLCIIVANYMYFQQNTCKHQLMFVRVVGTDQFICLVDGVVSITMATLQEIFVKHWANIANVYYVNKTVLRYIS